MSAFDPGVMIETVEDLYASYAALDIPSYYKAGEENPYAGRCRIVPRDASLYTMIPEREEARLKVARQIMGKLGSVMEVTCEKNEINYDQFAHASRIIVMFV